MIRQEMTKELIDSKLYWPRKRFLLVPTKLPFTINFAEIPHLTLVNWSHI